MRKNPKLPYALKITDVKLLAPIPNPPKIICLAFNYAEHAKEQGLQSPKDPVPVMKPRTSLCGSGAKIELADPVKDLDYEGELALIIGKRCKNVSIDEALPSGNIRLWSWPQKRSYLDTWYSTMFLPAIYSSRMYSLPVQKDLIRLPRAVRGLPLLMR